MIQTHRTPAYGWPNCVRLANAQVELIVTADVGPRIIHFGFVGGQNHLGVNPALHGHTGGDEWQAYGGHRLWHAPEVHPRTYAPDNGPVTVEEQSGVARFIQPTEATTGIQKAIDVRLAPDAAHAQITHCLRNHNAWAVELSPWALTVVAQGGTAIVPLPPRRPWANDNLLPVSQMALWSYTNLADPRWTFGHKYILLRQDPANAEFQKIGLYASDGWCGYARNGELFVKTFPCFSAARYPEFTSPFEIFTNDEILELETIAPPAKLAPGAVVEHVEHWHLFRDVPTPQNDTDVDMHVRPHIQSVVRIP